MDNIPFPQADNFDRIVKILDVNDEKNLSDFEFMCAFLDGITDRQVSYYLSAAMYIGIVNTDKTFSDYAKCLRMMSGPAQMAELASKIISDPVFGRTFFMGKILNTDLDNDDVIEIMKEKHVYFESDAMYKRRAQTVISWVKWINKICE